MKKRDFIKKISLATLGTPLYGSMLSSCIEEVSSSSVAELSSNEDFWLKIRKDYKLKPDYINLESGYYNIIPTPTLEALHKHINMVNYEGSYYMRTKRVEDKKRMAVKLAAIVKSPPKNVVITRNTTESLDMVIKGMDWKPGDEAVFAIQDYGAMRMMFEQVSNRFGVINKIVSVPNHPKSDEEIVELYANAITPNTKLLMDLSAPSMLARLSRNAVLGSA
jgi:selenocysteine lyase/cysteine desulfurase